MNQFNVILGTPASGKTTIAIADIVSQLKQGKTCLLLSYEYDDVYIYEQMEKIMSSYDISNIKKGHQLKIMTLKDGTYKELRDAVKSAEKTFDLFWVGRMDNIYLDNANFLERNSKDIPLSKIHSEIISTLSPNKNPRVVLLSQMNRDALNSTPISQQLSFY